jgi:hypothetical protein
MFVNRFAVLATALLVASCAALNVIHDPQSGLITRAQVPPLLQSVRCELVTFFDVNQDRQSALLHDHRYAGPFFPLDSKQMGAVFLDLKVVDTLSVPSGPSTTTINEKVVSNHGADTRTWHFGPTASDTNTYELNWPLVVPQSARLDLERIKPGVENDKYPNPYFPCYRRTLTPPNKELLARHELPDLERFARIYVDGWEPLAAWLLRSSAELDTAMALQSQTISSERIIPAQMVYTFTVQASIGADASVSLVTAKWNPIGVDLSGSTQQTSMLTIYVNGYDSINANGAKAGIIQVVQTPELAAKFKLGPGGCPPEVCSGAKPVYPISINPPQPQ